MPPLPALPPSTLLVLHIPPPPPIHPTHPTPSPPSSSSPFTSAQYKSIINHYTPPIESTLKALNTQTLIIALWAPFLGNGGGVKPRSHYCDRAQGILTGVYSLVEGLLGKLGRSKEGGEVAEVDVRVVFYYDDDGEEEDRGGNEGGWKWQVGPMFSIHGILGEKVKRRWKEVVYVVDGGDVKGEGGKKKRPSWLEEEGAQRVVEYTPPPPRPRGVDGVGDNTGENKEEIAAGGTTAPHGERHNIVAVGGTFDHLHSGHKLLLTTTAFLLDPPLTPHSPLPKLVIGLTGPKLLENKKHAEALQSWSSRARDTLHFLTSILTFSPSAAITSSSQTIQSNTSIPMPSPTLSSSPSHPQTTTTPPPPQQNTLIHTSLLTLPNEGQLIIEITEINDPYGPTIVEEAISALVVSEETRAGGPMVNEKRREKGWKELEVFVVGVVMEGDEVEKLSSTEIRRRKAALGKI